MNPMATLILLFVIYAHAEKSTSSSGSYTTAMNWCFSHCTGSGSAFYIHIEDACSCVAKEGPVTQTDLINLKNEMNSIILNSNCSQTFSVFEEQEECLRLEKFPIYKKTIDLMEKIGDIREIPKEHLPPTYIHWKDVKNAKSAKEYKELKRQTSSSASLKHGLGALLAYCGLLLMLIHV